MMRASCIAIALAACDPGVDVVARVPLPGKAVEKGFDTATLPVTCAAPTEFGLVTKAGGFYVVDVAKGAVLDRGSIKCLANGVMSAAMDRAGTVWASVGGQVFAVDPVADACKPIPLKLAPSALGFVWSPKLERDVLYAVADEALVVIDPDGFSVSMIGKMPLADVRSLTGNVDGSLFAFAGEELVTIARLDSADAALLATWQVKSPSANVTHFAGGAPLASGDFELVFGSDGYVFHSAKGLLSLDTAFFPTDPGVVAVAAPPCALVGK